MVQRFCLALLLCAALASVAHADPLWEDTVFAGGRDGQANAVVSDGRRVYAAGFAATPTGEVGIVRSYEPRTGTVVWDDRPSEPAAIEAFTALAVDRGRLFATALVVRGTGASGFDWLLRANDASSGALLWQDERDSAEAIDVATEGGRVFVTGAIKGPDADDSFVVRAHDAASGALLWEDLPAGDGTVDAGLAITARAGRVFAAGRLDDALHVVAYAQDTGAILWTQDRPGIVSIGGLVVAGDRVFVAAIVGAELRVYALAASTGSVMWRYRETATGTGPATYPIADVGLAATAERVFVGRVADGDDALFALDAASGASLWRRDDPGVTRSLEIGGGRVFGVAGAPGPLARGFDVATGATVWSSPLDRDGSALALARSGPLVFVGGVAGPGFGSFHVEAFDTSAQDRVVPIVPRGRRMPIVR
jgi:outer membrane protein assembly factor BamB